MKLSRLGTSFLLNHFEQFQDIKKHLSLSLKELLLALSSAILLAHQITQNTFLFGKFQRLGQSLLNIDAVIKFSLEKISMPAPKREALDPAQIKSNILESIISVIDEEIESLDSSTEHKAKLTIEALQTIKNVLSKNLITQASSSQTEPAEQQIKTNVVNFS